MRPCHLRCCIVQAVLEFSSRTTIPASNAHLNTLGILSYYVYPRFDDYGVVLSLAPQPKWRDSQVLHIEMSVCTGFGWSSAEAGNTGGDASNPPVITTTAASKKDGKPMMLNDWFPPTEL